jgi:hypothetical protein
MGQSGSGGSGGSCGSGSGDSDRSNRTVITIPCGEYRNNIGSDSGGNDRSNSQKCYDAQNYANGKCESASDVNQSGYGAALENIINGISCLMAQRNANRICKESESKETREYHDWMDICQKDEIEHNRKEQNRIRQKNKENQSQIDYEETCRDNCDREYGGWR